MFFKERCSLCGGKLDSGNGRATIYGDTVIRVSGSYALAMHIDTDESNAAACGRDMRGTIC